MLASQDVAYISAKAQQERKKIERLRASLHLAEAELEGAAAAFRQVGGSVDLHGAGEDEDEWDSDAGDPDYAQARYAADGNGDGPALAPEAPRSTVALPRAKHIVFCDDDDEAQEFDAAAFFDTAPGMLHRTFNRPRVATLESAPVLAPEDATERKEVRRRVAQSYAELAERTARLDQLVNVRDTASLNRKLLATKTGVKKVAEAVDGRPPVYRWRRERQR